MSRVFHRSLHADLPIAVHGEGPYLFDQAGRRYLDASGGAAVTCLGYNHPRIVDAIVAQARELAFTHNAFFTTAPAEQLAEFLTTRAAAVGSGFRRVAFVSDGSEANETALKLARQYWLERGEPSRTWFISRHQSFHGNTLGALSVSGHRVRRHRYLPYLTDKVEFIPPCYAYRCRRGDESEEAYGVRAANALDRAITRLGAENVAAFIAEPVVGATAGCLTAAAGYFPRIREICDRTGVLFIADEIMCGMGRTGTLFACEQEGVAPDIITCAKGLAAGYQPIGAVLVSDRIVDAIRNGTGVLGTGHTFMAHTLACATALAVQRTIEDDRLLENVRAMGAHLERRLRERFGEHPNVGDIRGRGLFWAIELVADGASKEPFDPALAVHARIKEDALRQGLICYPSGGTIDGVHGDHVMLAPPYIVDASHIDEALDLLARTFETVLTVTGQPQGLPLQRRDRRGGPPVPARAPVLAPIDMSHRSTPEATIGPFYPGVFVSQMPADLTSIAPQLTHRPAGQPIVVTMRFLDANSQPVPSLIVEVWQANAQGRYRHPADQSGSPLDPQFDGFARLRTSDKGELTFRTIKPGAHPAGDHVRAPHLRLTIFASGIDRLATQIFFDDETANESDPVLNSIPDRSVRQRLIARRGLPPKGGSHEEHAGSHEYGVSIILRGDGETPFFNL